MKTIPILIAVLLLSGCATKRMTVTTVAGNTPTIVTPSPVAVVGTDLHTAAANALLKYKEYEGGSTGMVWALTTALNAYRDSKPVVADVKSLIASWTGSKGQKLSERLSILFGASTGTPAQKMTALAQAAETVATDSGKP